MGAAAPSGRYVHRLYQQQRRGLGGECADHCRILQQYVCRFNAYGALERPCVDCSAQQLHLDRAVQKLWGYAGLWWRGNQHYVESTAREHEPECLPERGVHEWRQHFGRSLLGTAIPVAAIQWLGWLYEHSRRKCG